MGSVVDGFGGYVARTAGTAGLAAAGSCVGALVYGRDVLDLNDAALPLAALVAAVFSLGPAILISSLAKLRFWPIAGVGGIAAVGMVVMWRLASVFEPFNLAHYEFLWGWLVGIPVAATLVSLSRYRRRSGTTATPGSLMRRRRAIRATVVVVVVLGALASLGPVLIPEIRPTEDMLSD